MYFGFLKPTPQNSPHHGPVPCSATFSCEMCREFPRLRNVRMRRFESLTISHSICSNPASLCGLQVVATIQTHGSDTRGLSASLWGMLQTILADTGHSALKAC